MVTVLFTDIVGSTILGERLDPEALKGVLSEYFRRMREALARHGGLVEKYIGDAIVGVFGIPHLHEDDALRAVRAATEMRAALHGLNRELEEAYEVTIQARTGISTGEVLQGNIASGQTLALGDTVNVAARLEQAADADEILIGKTTFDLTRHAIRAEPLEDLALKGKAQPVPAYRLLSMTNTEAAVPRVSAALVGRSAELAALRDSFKRAGGQWRCERVAIVGTAGVGKSRLVHEFVAGLGDDATIVRGRCLSYGDHITYWPLKELVQDAIDVAESDRAETVKEKLGRFFTADNQGALAAELLGQLLGVGAPGTSNEEIAWALSRFCERLALDRPAVVILDDLQWADPAMLELLQDVEARCRDIRLMFVCILRPDLDQLIPWLSSDTVGHSLVLEPLVVSEARVLMENLLGGSIPEQVRRRVIEAAEGNPLFIEELLGMLIEQGQLVCQDQEWKLGSGLDRIDAPPTIRALLAARLDRLDTDERRVVEPAAVVGKVFQRQAVLELVDAALRVHVDSLLGQLVTKALVRPDPHSVDGQVYRFRHLLIQDAAYNAMSKRRRGELHESFARWLEAILADRVSEYEEIIGYHLEQAYRYRAQLGAMRESGLVLGRDAAAWLSRAARRSSGLGAIEAAARLLRRSASLLPKYEPARLPVLLDLAEALLQLGDLVEAAEVIADVEDQATAAGDTNAKARAAVLRLLRRFQDDPEGAAEQIKLDSLELLQTFTECEDELALAKTWRLLAHTDVLNCRFGPAGENFQRAADHARAGGDRREECDNLSWLVVALVWGSTPAVDGLTSCTSVLDRAGSDRRLQTTALLGSAVLEAMRGHIAEARRLSRRGKELIDELGPSVFSEVTKGQACGYLEMYAGDAAAAEREAFESYRFLERGGNRVWLSSLAGMLAQITYAQQRWTEAERYVQIAAEAADSSDIDAQIRWRGVGARLLARDGRLTDAHRVASEALGLAQTTDFLDMHADAFVVYAEVLTLQSRRVEAEAALDTARGLYERKGNIVSASQARRLSTDLKLGAQKLRVLVPLALA